MVDNQFDLNECYMYCDQMAREFSKLPANAPLDFMHWNDVFKELLKMIEDTEKTLDMCEAVMSADEMAILYSDGISEQMAYPAIPTKQMQFVITPEAFTFSFPAEEWVGEEISSLDGVRVGNLTYTVTSQKKKIWTVTIHGNLADIVENGFQKLLDTTLAGNVNDFFLAVKEHQANFQFPKWFLTYKLHVLIKREYDDFVLDGKIINSAALKQMMNQKGFTTEANMREARERLAADLPKFARYYDYQIKLFCLENE